MTTRIKILLGLILGACVATLVLLGRDDPVPRAAGPGAPPPEQTEPPPAATLQDDTTGKETTADVPGGTEIRTPAAGGPGDGSEFAQGVKGVVVDGFDTPVAGALVFLMPGLGLDALRMFQQHQEGVRFPPIAQTETAADGTFRLGIEHWQDKKTYEVRVLHPDFCDRTLPNVTPQPQDWWECGRIALKTGVTVSGRVTTENGLPVADATVTAKDGSGMMQITPVPGREAGIVATTDPGGNYTLAHLDPETMLSLSAAAQGYAKAERTEVHLHGATSPRIDFQLAPGLDIGGTVVDPKGKPIGNAKVTVAALSQKSRQIEETATDGEGRFAVPGLHSGVYLVLVEAEGYLEAEEKPVQAGEAGLTITLERQGRVRVTVLGKNGAPVRSYQCNLKVAFDDSDTYGNPVRSAAVKDAPGGTTVIEGVNPMTYVAEVFAAGYAKAFSERFTIPEGGAPVTPEVVVQLDQGGSIHGWVRDAKGQPLPGVEIATQPKGFVDHPFVGGIFKVPYTISEACARTDANGEFRLAQLYPGDYQLRLVREGYCTNVVPDILVVRDQESQLGEIRMSRGCLVSGIARYRGRPTGQVKVHVAAAMDEPSGTLPFSSEAVTDNEGRFLLDKRLMPGKYEVMATQQTQANPLIGILLMQKSKMPFVIREGQESQVLQVDLPDLDG